MPEGFVPGAPGLDFETWENIDLGVDNSVRYSPVIFSM
jgi:hypothetical protein